MFRFTEISKKYPEKKSDTAYFTLKRFLDVILVLILTPFGLVAIGVLGLAIWIIEGRPIIYRGQRIGLNGQIFTLYKLRTMIPDAEQKLPLLLNANSSLATEFYSTQKIFDDPRVTKYGKLLRKYSLDEIPQLINVAKGDMSLVGPRPIAVDEAWRYGGRFAEAFSVRPGLTGVWQVSGRNDLSYDTRVSMDVWYAKQHRILLDLWILLRTFRALLGGTGH